MFDVGPAILDAIPRQIIDLARQFQSRLRRCGALDFRRRTARIGAAFAGEIRDMGLERRGLARAMRHDPRLHDDAALRA
jgi:hypothetical protein